MKKRALNFIALTALGFGVNAQNNLAVMASPTTVCSGTSSMVTVSSTETNVSYVLRNSINTVVDGPTTGNGSDITFSTGNLTNSEVFNVQATMLSGVLTSGYSLDFDGFNDKVNTHYQFTTNNTLTIEGWFYPTKTSSTKYFSNYDGIGSLAGGDIVLDNNSGGNGGKNLRFRIQPNSGSAVTATVSGVMTLNTWHHIACTFDNGTVKIYVDGVQYTTQTASFTTIPPGVNRNLTLGEDHVNGGGLTFYQGKIDEFRVWTVARTGAQILANKNIPLTGSEPGLEMYYDFEDATGTVLTDQTGTSNGTLVDMDPATDWIAYPGIPTPVVMTQTPSITVLAAVVDEPVSASVTTICGADNSIISIANSVVGVPYRLQEVGGSFSSTPLTGTGAGLSFNTGTIASTTTYKIKGGKADYALDFDGVNDRLQTGYTLPGTNNYTIEGWFYPTGLADRRYFSNYDGSGALLSGNIILDNNGGANVGTDLRVRIKGTGGGANTLIVPNAIVLNEWVHIAYTFGSATAQLYVNGILKNVSSTGFNLMPQSVTDITLGEDHIVGGGAHFYEGKMDDFRIWTITKNVSTINSEMNASLTGSEAGLELLYRFENGAGASVTNFASSSTSNGTMVNMDPVNDWIILFDCSFDMTQTVTITVNPAIDNNTGVVGNTITATQNGATYRWLDCNNGNAVISGETGVSYSPSSNGNYAVEITMNGCTDTSACVNITITGIENQTELASIFIYPNPASNYLTINSAAVAINTIVILDVTGKVVMQLSERFNRINVSALTKGIYFIQIQSEKGIVNKKFIKE